MWPTLTPPVPFLSIFYSTDIQLICHKTYLCYIWTVQWCFGQLAEVHHHHYNLVLKYFHHPPKFPLVHIHSAPISTYRPLWTAFHSHQFSFSRHFINVKSYNMYYFKLGFFHTYFWGSSLLSSVALYGHFDEYLHCFLILSITMNKVAMSITFKSL